MEVKRSHSDSKNYQQPIQVVIVVFVLLILVRQGLLSKKNHVAILRKIDKTIVAATTTQINARAVTSTTTVATTSVMVPVLTYHRIRPHKLSDSRSSRSYITTPEVFEKELQYLQANHYTVVTLDELLQGYTGHPLPVNPVVLTFDDGYKEQYTYAFPLLKKYNVKGIFFIYTNAINSYPDFMTWEEVLDLKKEGMVIGAHTASHTKLTKVLSTDELQKEVLRSKKILEEKLSSPVIYFAYPYGLYNDKVIEQVKQAGFIAAVSLDKGSLQKKEDKFHIKRYTLGSSFDYFKTVIK